LIGCIYRPSDFTDMDEVNRIFVNARAYIDSQGFKDLLILGDFNLPLINWANGSIESIKNESGIEHQFSDIILETFLFQHVNISNI
jgi:hypothetical protein